MPSPSNERGPVLPVDYANPRPPVPVEPIPPPPGRKRRTVAVLAVVAVLVLAAVVAVAAAVRLQRRAAADERARATAERERALVLECLDAVRRVRADLANNVPADDVRRHLADAAVVVERARATDVSTRRRDQVRAIGYARDRYSGGVELRDKDMVEESAAMLAKVEAEIAAEPPAQWEARAGRP